jgi:hypothetical protein
VEKRRADPELRKMMNGIRRLEVKQGKSCKEDSYQNATRTLGDV